MTYRTRNLLIAFALAALAAVLVSVYVTQYKNHVESGQSSVEVYVAARDIPAGTPGNQLIDGNYLRKTTMERRNVTPGTISQPSEIASSYAKEPIYQGEQISLRRFDTAGAEGLRGQLSGTERALELDAIPSQVLSGALKTGDHVDVVGTWALPEGSSHHVSRVVLHDILVLAAPDSSNVSSTIGSNPNSTVTVQLKVTDTQASELFFLAKNGEWSLILRPPSQAGDGPATLEDAGKIASQGLSSAAYQSAMKGATQ